MGKIKESIKTELKSNSLYVGKDNGECREYERLEDDYINDILNVAFEDIYEVGDEFKVISDRPRTTKNKIYTIDKKIEDTEGIEYWFFNDRNQPACIYQSEIKRA